MSGFSPQSGDEEACRSAGVTMLPAGAKPVKRETVIDELLADSSILLYNRCQNQVTSLNAMGAFVWDSCDGEHDLESIVFELRELFPHSTTLDSDVQTLLDDLVQSDLIAPGPIAGAAVAVDERHVNA